MVQQRPGVTGKPVRLADPPPLLAGREDLLDELDARLTGGNKSGPRTVALCGLGGAGKTSVALAYAHRHLAEVAAAWQFAAEDPTVVAAGFAELAAQLGARDLLDVRDPVASVHGVLAASQTQWLLVFDNAPDPASVEGFLPPAGNGRVLITSRDPFWPSGQALEVPVLDPDVAADFLANRTGNANRQAALALADELGGLPLALEQAGAYIQATGDSLAGYLASFRRRRPDMLRRGEPTGYGETVATTWALAFGRLEQSAPQAVSLLRLLAYCAPDAIPLRLLLQSRPGLAEQLSREVAAALTSLQEDDLAVKDAIATLRRYSLVSPAADGSVSVHQLVQAVTADQMPAELAVEWRQATAAVIEAALPEDPAQPDTWHDFATLLPHAQAALTADSDGLMQIAAYLGYSGNSVAARELSRRMLDERVEVLGPEHPETLRVRASLAGWTGSCGDTRSALELFRELLPDAERVLGAEHPETLKARASLAHWTGLTGDPAGARDRFAALLPVCERVLGPEHSQTLDCRDGLAAWTGEAGDPAGARELFRALLPIRERVFGPEHWETLDCRGGIARWTGEAGDPAGARDQLAALLPVCERVLGPEHPDTLNGRHEVARWTGEAGDPAGARELFRALLPLRDRVQGPEHWETLDCRGGIARWTGEAGDPAGARDLYAALLPVCERVLGPDHPSTLFARANLAHWTGEADDPAGARDHYAALLPTRERVLGAEHPDTLTTRNNLAYWTGQAGDESPDPGRA